MGRLKEKVYIYNVDGTYYRRFESMTEFGKHFNISKNLLITNNKPYLIINNSFVAVKERVGREKIKNIIRYEKSPFVGDGLKISQANSKKGKVELYNLDGDLIAVFKSVFFFHKLTKYKSITSVGETNTLDGLKVIIYPR